MESRRKRKIGHEEKQEEGLASEWGQASRNNWNQAQIGLEYKPQSPSSTNDHSEPHNPATM